MATRRQITDFVRDDEAAYPLIVNQPDGSQIVTEASGAETTYSKAELDAIDAQLTGDVERATDAQTAFREQRKA